MMTSPSSSDVEPHPPLLEVAALSSWQKQDEEKRNFCVTTVSTVFWRGILSPRERRGAARSHIMTAAHIRTARLV